MIIYDSERKIMEILWEHGCLKAAEIAKLMNDSVGWNRNTTYTVLKKCIEKKYVKRSEPGYICSAVVSKKDVQLSELDEVLEKSFGGSVTKLFSALITISPPSKFEVKKIKKMLKEK